MADVEVPRSSDSSLSFIRDKPADVDEFGSHSKLASAIADVIVRDPEIKIIGILGPWGSGKSTIVQAIENELKDQTDKPVHFFTYDAWLHQSDPVRRSFLERLFSYLIDIKRADPEVWQEKLDELNGTVEKTITDSTPVLTTAGRFLIPAIALVPMGIALLGYDAVEAAFKPEGSTSAIWTLGVGAFLSLLPGLMALVLYLWWRPWGRPLRRRDFWLTNRKPYHEESILSVFSNKSSERTTNSTVRKPEPSSIEFQGLFRDVMKEAVSNGDRFVFVVDNLDRLVENQALQIWAAIRAFFLGASEQAVLRSTPYLPTIILPVDAGSIKRMFEADHGSVEAEKLANAFMAKTFDVTFEVPEPVLSDWQSYLAKQLIAAFGRAVTDVDTYWITRFVDEKRKTDAEPITPRHLNRVVNKILAAYLQRPSDSVCLTCIAYYIVFSDSIRSNVISFVSEKPVDILPPINDWQIEIASIHYGVAPEKAAQVLLSQPIRDAISAEDDKVFSELQLIPGFPVELRRVLSDIPIEGGPNKFRFGFVTNTALLLHRTINETRPWLDDAWRLVVESFSTSTTPDSISLDFEERFEALAVHTPDDLRKRFLEAAAAKLAFYLTNTSTVSTNIAVVLRAADRLVVLANSWSTSAPYLKPNLDASKFLDLLARSSAWPRVWHQLRTSAGSTELTSALAEKLRDPLFHVVVPASIRIMLNGNFAALGKAPKFDWTSVVSAAAELVRSGTENRPALASAALTLGILRQHSDAAKSILKELVDQGTFTTRINEAAAAEEYDLISTGYSNLIMQGGDFGPPSGWTWLDLEEKNNAVYKEIVARIHESFGPVVAPQIWEAIERAPSARPIVLKIIGEILSQGKLGNLHVNEILGSLTKYLTPLTAPQQKRFMLLLKEYPTFWEKLEAAKTDANFLRLVQFLIGNSETDRDSTIALVQKRLDSLDAAAWIGAIKSSHNVYDVGVAVAPDLSAWGLKSELFAALTALVPDLLRSTDRGLMHRWYSATQLLTPQGRNKVIKTLAEAISDGGYVADLLGILRTGEALILESDGFSANALVRSVMVPLLATSDSRKWLLGHRDIFMRALTKAQRQAGAAFQVEVDRLARSRSAGRREWADRLRTAFGLR